MGINVIGSSGVAASSSASDFSNTFSVVDSAVEWVVPAGVSKIAVTGCAPGGNVSAAAPAVASINIGAYAAGKLFGTTGGANSLPLNKFDAYTGRGGNFSKNNAIADASGVYYPVVSPDGITIIIGSNGTSQFNISRDSGKTFTLTSHNLSMNALDGVFHPTIPGLVVMASNTSAKCGMYSTDFGYTWTAITGVPAGFYSYRIRYLNGTFVMVGTADGNNRLAYSTDGKTWVFVNPGNSAAMHDIAYQNSTWVLVGTSSTVLTATTLNGTWTSRTWGGPASTIACVEGANGVFISGGNTAGAGSLRRSADGITWTAVTGAPATGVYGVRGIAWSPAGINSNGTWVALNSTNSAYASTDNGVNVTNVAGVGDGGSGLALTSATCCIGTPYGVIVIVTSANKIVGLKATQYQVSLFGGDATVLKNSSGVLTELLRLESGQTNSGNTGGSGGSYVGNRFAATSGPGIGEGGIGAYFISSTFATSQNTGAGGQFIAAPVASMAGGGAAKQLADIVAMTNGNPNNLRFPGASGGSRSATPYAGGGSSIFGVGGTTDTNGFLPAIANGNGCGCSAGAATSTTAWSGGGGGESVYRYLIYVTPGDTLLFNSGTLNARDLAATGSGYGGVGFLQVEY